MAGAGGDGIVSAGESLITAAAARGLPRDPHQELRPADPRRRVVVPAAPRRPEPVHTAGGVLDVAVALNWDDFLRFGAELPVGGPTVVIYDAQTRRARALPLAGVHAGASRRRADRRAWRASWPAPTRPRTPSSSACWRGGSA